MFTPPRDSCNSTAGKIELLQPPEPNLGSLEASRMPGAAVRHIALIFFCHSSAAAASQEITDQALLLWREQGWEVCKILNTLTVC